MKSISLTSIKHLVIVLILVPISLFVACTSNQSASNGNTSDPVTSAVGYQKPPYSSAFMAAAGVAVISAVCWDARIETEERI